MSFLYNLLVTQQKIKFYTSIVVCLCLVLGLFVFFVNLSVTSLVRQDIFLPDQLPDTYQTAIILGAKVYSNGGLSGMTQDRADTAISLYQKQKITKLLVSGDHGQKNYDEVNSIKDYLLSKGIPKANIYLDHAGFDTYDSIYRARDIFEVESAVIITQDFHLPRALYIAQQLGLNAVGVPADIQNYGHMERVIVREKIATLKAWLDVVLHSQPKFLGDKIPMTGDSSESWDKPFLEKK